MSVTSADFQAVLFDCDGVLVDSESIANRALHRTLQDIGLEMTLDEVANTFTGQSFAHCLLLIEKRLGGPIPDIFVPNNRTYFRTLLQDELVSMPGIERVLNGLKVPFAVVTNSQYQEMNNKLKYAGLDAYFPAERRFDTETLGVAKPDPAIYQLAAKSLGVDIHQCLILEDSFPGITAGTRSGATVWGYRPHLTADEIADFGLTRILTDWSEFPL